MTNTPCLYAIVRFCPFIETEEFANVGILMIAPEKRFFEYKLMTRRHARVTNFFEQLDGTVFRSSMQNIKEELDRVGEMLRVHGFDKYQKNNGIEFAKNIFMEIVRPRETVVKFSKMRAVLASEPKAKLNELYGYYVERDFVTKEYREAVLERGMRKWMHDAGLADKFEKMEIGNDEYHATFPFVQYDGDELVQAVKPLNLTQDQPSKILDHGGQWLFKIQTLKRKNLLPGKILFAVEGPDESSLRNNAYREIVDALLDIGTLVLPYKEKERIMELVKLNSVAGTGG